MTKKDYELIANWIKPNYEAVGNDTKIVLQVIIGRLCSTLKSDNPHFNRGKFLEACGLQKLKPTKCSRCKGRGYYVLGVKNGVPPTTVDCQICQSPPNQ